MRQANKSMSECLCVIPSNFSQKYDFPEIKLAVEYLRKEQFFLDQIDATLSAIEKVYKSNSASIIQATAQNAQIDPNLPGYNSFKSFYESQIKQFKKYEHYAQLIANLKSTQLNLLVSKFQQQKHYLKAEFKKIQLIIAQPLDDLFKSIRGYDKYFKALYSAAASPNNQPQQLMKALQAHDEKLFRIQAQYAAFHAKFIAYSVARKNLFDELTGVLVGTRNECDNVINSIAQIDSSFLGIQREQYTDPPFEFNTEGLWEEEKTYVNNQFRVTLSQKINVNNKILKPGDQLLVVSAKGDFWTLKDNISGQFWNVPQEYLAPIP